MQVLNRGQATTWTVERLRRTVRRLADEGIIEAACLTATGRSKTMTGWSGWSPGSRRERPIARSSRSPPNLKPCVKHASGRDAVAPLVGQTPAGQRPGLDGTISANAEARGRA